jgi:phosphohistidine phosphatase
VTARASCTLHLVRHADAEGAAPSGGDAARSLTPKGALQAAFLAGSFRRRGVRVERLCTSSKTRARETAALAFSDGPEPLVLEELAAGDTAATVRALREAAAGAATVAAVGHEPWLSQLAATLLAGRADALHLAFRKATVATLEGPLEPGAMTLVEFTSLRLVRALHDDGAASDVAGSADDS